MSGTRRAAGLALCCLVLLAACNTSSDNEALGPRKIEPATKLELEAEFPSADALPPGALPKWSVALDSIPQQADDTFVGLMYPDGLNADLHVLGFDTDGKSLWDLATNPSCAGYALTEANGRTLVVALDSDASVDGTKLATRTVASAFDIRTGEQVWGPVAVPGPVTSNGLVFSEVAKSVLSTAHGPRIALSPATGQIVADEEQGDRIFYENQGTLLLARHDVIQAIDINGNGGELWNVSGLQRPPGVGDAWLLDPDLASRYSIGNVFSFNWVSPAGGKVAATYDLASGRLLGVLPGQPTGIPFVDSVSGRAILRSSDPADETARLTAVDPEQGLLWSVPTDPLTAVDAVVNETIFTHASATSTSYSLATGDVLGSGSWFVPATATSTGRALIATSGISGDRQIYVAANLKG